MEEVNNSSNNNENHNTNEMSPLSHVVANKNYNTQNDEIIMNGSNNNKQNNNDNDNNNNAIAEQEDGEGSKGKKSKKNKKKKAQNEVELNKLQKNSHQNKANKNDHHKNEDIDITENTTTTITLLHGTDNNHNNGQLTKTLEVDGNINLKIIENQPLQTFLTVNEEILPQNIDCCQIEDSTSKDNMLNGQTMKETSENINNQDHVDNLSMEHKDEEEDNYDDDDDYDNGLLVQFLDEANRIAEAKLAQRRQARAEAREIRMRELERQQKEQEQNADRVFDLHATTVGGIGDALARNTTTTRLTAGIANLSINSVLNATRANSMCSRRSSEDSLEEEGRSLRDIRHELKDVEERFRKAMIANAQLDNERASQTYQIQLLKDKLEEMEESYAQLQREFKDKSRECNAFKRQLDKVSEELKLVQGQLTERDTLIAEQGFVIVAVENDDGSDARRALVTMENAQLLGTVQGSLDVRLKKFTEEKQTLMAEVQRLQEQLETYKSYGKQRSMTNGPMSDEDYDAQREANKIISDYKYKLQKAEQEIASLQSSLARSETQVIRYKSTAEAAEKAEAELKIERRKLQRENREAMERMEELETANNHLLKRMDKLKNVKSALLKDL